MANEYPSRADRPFWGTQPPDKRHVERLCGLVPMKRVEYWPLPQAPGTYGPVARHQPDQPSLRSCPSWFSFAISSSLLGRSEPLRTILFGTLRRLTCLGCAAVGAHIYCSAVRAGLQSYCTARIACIDTITGQVIGNPCFAVGIPSACL